MTQLAESEWDNLKAELARLRVHNEALTGALYGDLVQLGRWRTLVKDGKQDLAAEAMDGRQAQLRQFLSGWVPKGAMAAAEQPAAPEPEPPVEREPEPPPPALAALQRPVPCPPQAERYPVPACKVERHAAAEASEVVPAERDHLPAPAEEPRETRPRSRTGALPINAARLQASEPVPTRRLLKQEW